jgi:hypothetical protein
LTPEHLFVDAIDDLSTDWLLTALPSDSYIALRSAERIGVGNLSQTARLFLDGGPADPRTMLLKFQASEERNRRTGSLGHRFKGKPGFYATEHIFYREVAPRISLRTPQAYANEISSDGTRFILLLEDIRDGHITRDQEGLSGAQLASAFENAARLHGSTWGRGDSFGFSRYNESDAAIYARNVRAAMDVFDDNPHFSLTAEQHAAMELFGEHVERWFLDERWGQSIIHGDFRADNLLFRADGECVVVDWQLAAHAAPGWDVGYLIALGFGSSDKLSDIQLLLRQYHAETVAAGAHDFSWEQVWGGTRSGFFLALAMAVMGTRSLEQAEGSIALVQHMLTSSCDIIIETEAAELFK